MTSAVNLGGKQTIPPDFDVRVFGRFDASASALLRELDESDRFVQKSADFDVAELERFEVFAGDVPNRRLLSTPP